jgi:hypothetical protein
LQGPFVLLLRELVEVRWAYSCGAVVTLKGSVTELLSVCALVLLSDL